MKKYLDMSRTEYALIIKLVICTIIATLFSWLMGDIYSITTAVTANLFLWCDRGYRGSLKYATRRVLVQIVQGILVIGLIFPCKYFEIPIPDAILIMISSCMALCVGLPINYKCTYAPFNCTLANATFVISCATVQNMSAFPKRVLQCIMGALIGYFVNYIIFSSKDRVHEIMKLSKECVRALIDNADLSAYNKNMLLLEKELGFLIEDNGKNGRITYISSENMEYLIWHKQLIISLKAYKEIYEEYQNILSVEYKTKLQEIFDDVITMHRKLLENHEHSFISSMRLDVQAFDINKPEELCVAGRLLEYVKLINLSNSYSYAACKVECSEEGKYNSYNIYC
jgi:hypothetical protein